MEHPPLLRHLFVPLDMGQFEVRIEGDSRLVVRGEVDLATSPQLVSAIESLGVSGPQRVVVDLGAVTFIDSTGLSALRCGRPTGRTAR
jgi:anti-anti-sigma factor